MTPFWDTQVAQWVAAMIPGTARGFGPCQAMGVERGDTLVAGVVFHNFHPESMVIEISCAALDPRWMTRTVMNEAFGYVFDHVECQMAAARIDERNATARKLWRGLGADEFVIPRLRGPQTAEAIYTLTREQWAQSKFKR